MIVVVIAGQNTLTAPKVIAAVMVFLGVYIVTRSKSRADVEADLAKKTALLQKVE